MRVAGRIMPFAGWGSEFFRVGGVVAYQTALSYDKPLAGLLALSTYLATKDSIVLSDANKNLNIAIHHGTQDPVVPVQLGQEAKAWLESKGYQPQFYSYPMAHQVCMPQLKIIGKWLNDVLA
jgi:phospholipase/carboxylesterase